jgi:hypothetical protein
MIDRHWDIAADRRPNSLATSSKVSTQIVVQGRAYGLRDQECRRRKGRTCMLDSL